MVIQAVISLVSIEACGLYSSNGRKFEYGDMDSILNNLSQWADKKPLGITKTYEGDDKHNPCYLYDIYKDQESWLIAMWNETESSNGTVASVNSQAIVGQASISSTNLPQNNIPGFPTYFWVLPKEKLVVSIKFEYRRTGVQEFARYLWSFLAFFSGYAVTKPSKTDETLELEVLGYRQSSDGEPEDLRPRVKLKEVNNPGEIDFIKSNASSVSKIVCKTTLLPDVPLHKALWQKLHSLLNSQTSRTTKNLSKAMHISYDMKDEFSSDDVESIIAEWEENKDEDVWTDRGFYIAGKPYWLRKSIARDTFDLQLIKNNHSVNLADLAKALRGQKQHILNLKK